MTHFVDLFWPYLGWSLLFVIGGIVVTVLVARFFRGIIKGYHKVRIAWEQWRNSLPTIVRMLVRVMLLLGGSALLGLGVILLPLPGPGAILILFGVAMLDLELGFVVPATRAVLSSLPPEWRSNLLENGLDEIQKRHK